MAFIWMFSAKFNRLSDSLAFGEVFDSSPIDTKLSGKVFLNPCASPNSYSLAPSTKGPLPYEGWYLNGTGGSSDPTECAAMREVGDVIYERLRAVKPTYNFALIGVEVDEGIHVEDILDTSIEEWELYHGIVVSPEFYKRLNSPSFFEPFGEGFWLPWKGP